MLERVFFLKPGTVFAPFLCLGAAMDLEETTFQCKNLQEEGSRSA